MPAAKQSNGFDWSGRILPRSVLGIAALILSLALGAAFSGAVLYAYYQARLDSHENAITKYANTFDERLKTATAIIKSEQNKAREAVRSEIGPIKELAASGETINELLDRVAPSVWFVSTLADDGSPSVGSAFVVFADADQSFLITSYTTVKAATTAPAPAIQLRKGNDVVTAKLETWEVQKDLALVSVKRGNLPRLDWGGNPDIGERVFAVSGLGSKGASASQGIVGDVSATGIQHDAPIGVQFQGGPLLNSDGEVIGVASRTYAPLNFAPDSVWFAPPIRGACDKVLRCPS
ncbi:MAG: serine protease [Acidobacteria bacterium]|nr:serine protease [Acidobacteriota bacterium]